MSIVPSDLSAAGYALKSLAADHRWRAAFLASPVLSDLFTTSARRYVVAADRAELSARLPVLSAKGYRIGVEFVGEEADDPDEVEAVVAEYLSLIDQPPLEGAPVQLGFDLSNIGMLISRELAVANTARILAAARPTNVHVIISMERSEFVEGIIDVFAELAPVYPNVGLTLQAHLHRTVDDLDVVAKYGRKVRLVKGVYREPSSVALPRGTELNLRYADLAERLLGHGLPVVCGTHDAAQLRLLDSRGITPRLTEIEMLHGARPALLRRYHRNGVPARIATVYGRNWWLHFLHRLAEFPPNVLSALADMGDPSRVRFGTEY